MQFRRYTNFVWTNESVRQLAGDTDPVETVERLAREKVLQALDSGWRGPPFNPIDLADILNIPVEPRVDVADARTVPFGAGIKIEFNPTQARERLRFSIAHEVAHALFPDVSSAVRHRGGTGADDDWQLELLCNIAAAEFIMPIGSLAPIRRLPSIENLMAERRKFDVSAEAFLIRAVKVTEDPVLMFCASSIEKDGKRVRYRVDYVVPSRGWLDSRPGRISPPETSAIADCSAIGYTAKADEVWAGIGEVSVECVGIPPYPGTRLPRVAGLVRKADFVTQPMPSIQYVVGDVLAPRGGGAKIICQLVNDSARRWGGGVAYASAKKFPDAQRAFAHWFSSLPPNERLGQVHFASVKADTLIASIIGQRGHGRSESPRIRYSALEAGLRTIVREAEARNASIHMPRIGTGAAGGSWALVEQLVLDEVIRRGQTVTVYDLPPQNFGKSGALFD